MSDSTVDNEVTGRWDTLRAWIDAHDESRVFLVLYMGLAIGLSLFVSLFWLGVVVGVHLLLELVKQSRRHKGWWRTAVGAVWEIKLDISLVMAALVLALYLEPLFGVLGLKSAAQATRGATAGVRAAGWQSTIRSFLITVDEGLYVAKSVVAARRQGRAPRSAPSAMENTEAAGEAATRPTEREVFTAPFEPRTWTKGDAISMALLAGTVLLVLIAPWATGVGVEGAWEILSHELRPFPTATPMEELLEGG